MLEQDGTIEFDGGYGRRGQIYHDTGTCVICKAEDVPCIAIDASEGEYTVVLICLNCCHNM